MGRAMPVAPAHFDRPLATPSDGGMRAAQRAAMCRSGWGSTRGQARTKSATPRRNEACFFGQLRD